MKRLTGKILDFVLLIMCFALLVIVIPNWLCVTFITGLLILCLISMIGSGFFR